MVTAETGEKGPQPREGTRMKMWRKIRSGLLVSLMTLALVACGGGGGSSSSTTDPGGGTTNPTVPTAPTNVVATGGSGQVTLSWNAVSGATGYNVYWSQTAGVTPVTGTKIAGAASPYVHTNLAAGTTYYYVVTAFNGAGESAASGQVSATTNAAPAPIVSASIAGTVTSIDSDGTNSYLTVLKNNNYDVYIESYAPGATQPRWSTMVAQGTSTIFGTEGMKYFSAGNKLAVFYTIEDPGSSRTKTEPGTIHMVFLDASTGQPIANSDKILGRGQVWSTTWDNDASVFRIIYFKENVGTTLAQVDLNGTLSGSVSLQPGSGGVVASNLGIFILGTNTGNSLLSVEKIGSWIMDDLSFSHQMDIIGGIALSDSAVWSGGTANALTNPTSVIVRRNASTGAITLEKDFTTSEEPEYFFTDSAGNLLGAFRASKKLFRLNAATGNIDWQQQLTAEPNTLTYIGGSLYVSLPGQTTGTSQILKYTPEQ